jgi:glyoxylase-like metal-dependent hydrolase (beta-lactamase superfamily II)
MSPHPSHQPHRQYLSLTSLSAWLNALAHAYKSAVVGLVATVSLWAVPLCAAPAMAAPCPTTPLTQAAPGVWVWESQNEELSADNRAQIVSNVVLVSEGEATVIDPGATHLHGVELAQAIACQLHAKVTRVINTHAHAENTLGDSAFSETGALVASTAGTRAAMQSRCPSCLAHIQNTIGASASAGTRIVIPTQTLKPPAWLNVGSQRWWLQEWRQAHTESDLTLWNPKSRTLIAAGLVYHQRLPELSQGRLDNWLRALLALRDLQPLVVIGQRVGDSSDLIHTHRYLCDLHNAIAQRLSQGETASQADQVELPTYRDWVGYAQRQSFNVQRAWRELEGLWMSDQLTPCVNP